MNNFVTLLANSRFITIIGMSKNAGKTTTLNFLIKSLTQAGYSLGLTSIGRDGEETDLVTNTKKPRIFVPRNTLIATTEGLLPYCDISKEILHVSEINTPLGRVITIRALSAGYVQIAGASVVSQMSEVTRALELFGADKIITDGAVSRKSPVSSELNEAVILCTGAAFSTDLNKVISETKHMADILTLPKNTKDDAIFLSGAVTDSRIDEILRSGSEVTEITADDPAKIFLTAKTLGILKRKGIVLSVKKPLTLTAITINPTSPLGFSFPPDEFLCKVQEVLPVPVYDVMKINERNSHADLNST